MYSKPNRGNRAKNWFDAEDDDEPNSLHSSEATFQNREDDEGKSVYKLEPYNPQIPTKTEVTAGLGPAPRWTQGVTVTRQVLVATSSV